MGGDELFSAVAAPTLGSPTSPDRKLLRHPILASQYKELVTRAGRTEATPHPLFGPHPTPVQFKTHPYIDKGSL